MQQQIQVERNEQNMSQSLNIARDQNHSIVFEMVNDNEQVIQEDITEHYQQDFDSVSNQSQNKNQQIKQDFEQIEQSVIQNPTQRPEAIQKSQPQYTRESQEHERLQIQCKQMENQIATLTQQINKYYLEKSEVQSLQQLITQNNKILQDIQAEQITYFQTKMGKDSLTPTLLNHSQDVQQNLIEQVNKLKVLINMSYLEVCRLKRQTKKNQQLLPFQEENKQQFYQKYNKLKRQVQDKKQKLEQKQQKDNELVNKVIKLKEKIAEIQPLLPLNSESNQVDQVLVAKYLELKKKKENDFKRNAMIAHQIQNNGQSISRNIIQLRKQNLQYQEKILVLEQKNIKIQEESQKLIQQYQQAQTNRKPTEKYVSNFLQTSISPSKAKPIFQQQKSRKYRSETKNSFANNIFLNDISSQTAVQNINKSNERYIGKKQSISLPPPLFNQNGSNLKIQLSHDSTSNTLRQFKLKLPSATPKSKKNLNVSLDITKNIPTPTRSRNRTDFAKLSIAQRLERIQQLQKQDRIYSNKLYETNNKEQLISRTKPVGLNLNQGKDINSAGQLPLYQKQVLRSSNDLSFDSNFSFHSSKQSRQSKIIDVSQNLNQSKVQQSEIGMNPSQISDRINHKIFKKRIIYREKKISEEYMKVLQQRGRKILQLDNQSEN